MADGQSGWGFYGRRKELARLSRWMSSPRFAPMAVIGGRGVGKTRLIEEAVESLRGRKPCIYLQLPEVRDRKEKKDRFGHLKGLCDDLARQAQEQGLSDAVPPPDELKHEGSLMFHFRNAFEAVLKQGAVVALDEFQNSEDLLLVDGVKLIIDRTNNRPGMGVTGNVLVAGSHQQKMLKMLHGPREQLYQRIDLDLHLRPLSAAGVLEMAADQGWLDCPYRVLTAYAAFGGSPRRWRRLARDQADGTMPEPADRSDRAWRLSFIERELRRLRSDRKERYFDAAFVDLSEEARIIAHQLAMHPGGVRWSQIVERFKGVGDDAEDKAEDGFHILMEHLGIAEAIPVGEPFGGQVLKVRLTEPAALFELTASKAVNRLSKTGAADAGRRLLDAVSQLEGKALERLTEEWLACFGMFDRVSRSVELRRPDGGMLEIDIVAETGDPARDERWLAMCSCKRDAGRHSLRETAEDFDLYLRLRQEAGDRWDGEVTKRYLFSPEWPKTGIPDDGFDRFGLAEMARSLKLELKPWPRRPSPAAEPELTPAPVLDSREGHRQASEPDYDGPEFDM